MKEEIELIKAFWRVIAKKRFNYRDVVFIFILDEVFKETGFYHWLGLQ
jgi:hypothetical protein